LVLAHIAGVEPGVAEAALAQRALHPPLHLPDRQIPEAAGGALLHRIVCDVPGDAAVVGDVENQALFAVQQTHASSLWGSASLVGGPGEDKSAGRRRDQWRTGQEFGRPT